MAEVEELRANPDAAASGTVIESKLDPGRGPVVTILISRGTLEVGDALVAGAHWGRVRAMHDFLGNRDRPGAARRAGRGARLRRRARGRRARARGRARAPRPPARRRARDPAEGRVARLASSGKRVSLEDIFGSGLQELNLVLKADVAGSLEAIEDEIAKLPQDEVSVNVIRRAVGAVTESDVMLAAASDAVILAFNVRPVGDARAVAEREGVEIRHYSVIYRAIEELRSAMQGMLAPEEVEEALGSAEVRQIFRASRVGTIAGSHVTEGKITRGSKVRLVRDGTVIYDGEIAQPAPLQRGRRARSPPASTAASCCGTTPTSRKATCSRPTRRARSSASSPEPAVARWPASGFVAVLVIDLHFPDAGSLKGKRKELSSIKAQLHGRLGRAVSRDRPPGSVAARRR